MKTNNTPGFHADAATRLDGLWPTDRPVVMGIVNTTPDSFSDGGRCFRVDDAVAEAERQLAAGATIIDVGGESTRPGADPVAADEECRRVLPVIRELRRRHQATVISVDTTKVEVAEAAIDAGADVVNDVSGAAEAGMLELVAESGVGIVLMHRRGTPRTMQLDTHYDNVVAEVHDFLRRRATAAARAGVAGDRVWLDPGIGFGKSDRGNLTLLTALPDLAALGHPVVVGASRKSMIGRLTGAPIDDRLGGTLASLIPTLGIARAVVRVHDVGPVSQFLDLASHLRESVA